MDVYDEVWPSAYRYAGELVRQVIEQDPEWWELADSYEIEAADLAGLLGWVIWRIAYIETALSVLRGDPPPAVEEADWDEALENLCAAGLDDSLRAMSVQPPASDVLPDPAALAGVLAIAADQDRPQRWQKLHTLSKGVLVAHILDAAESQS